MAEIFSILGKIAGIGGLVIGTLLILYREFIRKNVFARLSGQHSYRLLRLFLILVWSVAVLGIGAWLYAEIYGVQKGQGAVPAQTLPTVPFRLTYYRMSGVAPTFLIKGLLAPEWERLLGGQQNIIPNSVLAEAKSFLDRFSEPFEGHAFYGDYPPLGHAPEWKIDDYARHLTGRPVFDQGRLTSDKWKAYLGAKDVSYIFVPDFDAAREIFASSGWPQGFKIYYPAMSHNYLDQGEYPPPTVWRYLRQTDLTSYYDALQRYRERLTDRIAATNTREALRFGLPWYVERDDYLRKHRAADKIIDSLFYLTAHGIPEGFMIVEGQPGVHGGWSFESQVRNLELEVAVFENSSGNPLELKEFEYREATSTTLRYIRDTDTALASAAARRKLLYPPGILVPGEKLVIPIRIHFTLTRPLEVLEQETRAALARKLATSSTRSIEFVDPNSHKRLFTKDVDFLLHDEAPRFIERMDFGPAWSLDSVFVNGTWYPIRKPDWTNFAVFLSSEKGSCPYVFTLQPETGIWRNEGHVLLGATAPELMRSDEIELTDFHGKVQIRELEAEIAVIKGVRLRIIDPDGFSRVFEPTASSVKESDLIYLERGNAVEFTFGIGGDHWIGKRVWLIVDGYYIPYSNTQLLGAYNE